MKICPHCKHKILSQKDLRDMKINPGKRKIDYPEVIRLKNNGASDNSIAKKMNRTSSAIRYILKISKWSPTSKTGSSE